jgi:protein-S-isoprenylcysteine O-methyltransferase Ste14
VQDWLQIAGYWIAVLLVVSLPPAVLYWYIIHPLARFWRRVGPWVTFPVVIVCCVAFGVALYRSREALLGEWHGYRWPLVAIGLALYALAIWLEIQCRRHLRFSILAGAPEVGRDPGRLLEEGIYRYSRNPRYLSVIFGVGAWALILNYSGIYVLAVLQIPALYLVILLEERELQTRFGSEFTRYKGKVPRLIPRLRSLRPG